MTARKITKADDNSGRASGIRERRPGGHPLIFHFEWLDGTVTHMEEPAYQRWEGERIAAETFFYDPAQRIPRKLQA